MGMPRGPSLTSDQPLSIFNNMQMVEANRYTVQH